jgi:tetratricopeptide (TPR) repeat protein
MCSNHINEIIKTASFAYDLDVLKNVYTLKALISIFFDNYEQAVSDFKMVRCIADEDENLETKMEAYECIGKCYQQLKNYENALKCFKKQLELSWRLNDIESELRSYELIAVQHYYLGNLQKSKYYNDRSMRGKFEKKTSKIRMIYEDVN